MSKKKILILAVVILLVGAYVAKGMLMPPPKTHDKITGTIYLLPKEFLVNLADGKYGKVDVALVLAPGQSDGATAASGGASSDQTLGTLPEEAAVRDIITNELTDSTASSLINSDQRVKLKHKILLAIRGNTDIKLTDVLFTDVAVQ
ncbi:MAG TPA: flagellar basal body-associated FliL family protein [Solirubrobacteraceae bacterium]|nr:flagellar basal body-associated FliL family protein [Solirubrobacteraceae bacterium]